MSRSQITTISRTLLIAVALAGALHEASAQELEPGAYQNAPVGLNVAFVGYGFSTGNILLDTTLPIEGASARVHVVGLGYLRTLDLFGLSAKLDALVPVSWARFEGFVAGEFRTRSPQGLADPRVRLAVNFLGSPALDLPGFMKYRQGTILGTSLQVVLPLGQYDETRLINLGANRWSFRPEVGLSQALGRWTFEFAAGSWFFTENPDYFGGVTVSQRPLHYAKGNAIFRFRPSLWTSFSYGYAGGGQTILNDDLQNDLQKNSRIAATLAIPLNPASAVRVVFTSGLTTRLGADFDSIGFSYQYTWPLPRPGRN
jgi:hypothetical protein